MSGRRVGTVGDNELRDTSIFRKIKTPEFDRTQPVYSFATIPTPSIDLKPFQGLITTWFQDDISCNNIAKRLADKCNSGVLLCPKGRGT